MGTVYVDNQVPIGSKVLVLATGNITSPTVKGSYVFENITLNRSGKVVERTDEVGAPNGWALVNGFSTGSSTVQVATSATAVPGRGWFASAAFDGSSTAAEWWVITDVSQPFDANGYYKCNVTIRLSTNPPTA